MLAIVVAECKACYQGQLQYNRRPWTTKHEQLAGVPEMRQPAEPFFPRCPPAPSPDLPGSEECPLSEKKHFVSFFTHAKSTPLCSCEKCVKLMDEVWSKSLKSELQNENNLVKTTFQSD